MILNISFALDILSEGIKRKTYTYIMKALIFKMLKIVISLEFQNNALQAHGIHHLYHNSNP